MNKLNKEFKLDDVLTYDGTMNDRPFVKFIRSGYNLDKPCCKYPDIEWNLIY